MKRTASVARLQPTEPVAPEMAGAVLTVDLARLQDNWRLLASRAAPAECGATVKADAYGLGLEACAPALWDAGCRTFFVTLPHEGIALRAHVPEATVYVLDGLLPRLGPIYVEHDLYPALSSPEEVAEWAALSRQLGRRLKAALHIDTGINRLGLSPAQTRALGLRRDFLDAIDVRLAMSHLACADERSNPMNGAQCRLFDELRSLLPAAPASLANSPGIFLGSDFRHDLVRPGIALYGGNPFLAEPNPMAPVVRLEATILQVRELTAGEAVGYGATWTAARPSRIAVVAVGYRDGFPRVLSTGGAQVFLGGRLAPIVGRISMDLITVDVTDVAPEFARRGAAVELLGDHVTVDDVARWAGTIPYEILTGLGSRYARLYSSAPTHQSRQRKDRP